MKIKIYPVLVAVFTKSFVECYSEKKICRNLTSRKEEKNFHINHINHNKHQPALLKIRLPLKRTVKY